MIPIGTHLRRAYWSREGWHRAMEGTDKEPTSSLLESALKQEECSPEDQTDSYPRILPSMTTHEDDSPNLTPSPAPQAEVAPSGCPTDMQPPPGFLQPHATYPQAESERVITGDLIPPSSSHPGDDPHPTASPAGQRHLPVLPPSTSVVPQVQSNPSASILPSAAPSLTSQDAVPPNLASHPTPQARDTSSRYPNITRTVDFEQTQRPGLVQPQALYPFLGPTGRGDLPYSTAASGRLPVLPPLQLQPPTAGMPPVHSYYEPYKSLYDYNSSNQAYSHGESMQYPPYAPSNYHYGGVHAFPHYPDEISHQYQAQAGYEGTTDGGPRRQRQHQRGTSYAVNPGRPYIKDNTPQSVPKGASLFVFHVPNEMTNDDLYQLFAPYGTILGLRIAVEERTGRGKGFAYVDYASAQSAGEAIKHLHRHQLLGKRLKVEHKRGKQYEEKERHSQSHWSNFQPPQQYTLPVQEYAGRPGAQYTSTSIPPPSRHHSAPLQVRQKHPNYLFESTPTPPLPPLEHFRTPHGEVLSLSTRAVTAEDPHANTAAEDGNSAPELESLTAPRQPSPLDDLGDIRGSLPETR